MSNTVFPGNIDSPYNPTTNDTLGSATHHQIEGLQNDAIVQLETKLGTGSSNQVPSNGSFLVGNGTGATQWVTTLTSPSITTSLKDANNNTWIAASPTASAVNYVSVSNAATNNAPTIGSGGSDTNIDLNIISKGSGKVRENGSSMLDFRSTFSNFIQSGCIWSIGSGLQGSMTAGSVWINGVEYSVPSVANHSFTASVDTYIDYTVGTGITYTAVSNNAASPSLAANSVRIGIAVSSTSLSSFNQGAILASAPVVNGSALAVSDSIGNKIYPVNPNYGTIGYRQITSNFTSTSSSYTAVTGLSVPVIAPAYRTVRLLFQPQSVNANTAGDGWQVAIYRGASSGALTTRIGSTQVTQTSNSYQFPLSFEAEDFLTTTALNYYTVAILEQGSHTLTVAASAATDPAFLSVEVK